MNRAAEGPGHGAPCYEYRSIVLYRAALSLDGAAGLSHRIVVAIEFRPRLIILCIVAVVLMGACTESGSTESPPTSPRSTDGPASASDAGPPPAAPQPETSPSPTPVARVPEPTPTPAPEFEGFDFEVGEGTFWEYRWSSTSRSCAQGSGCSTKEDSGVFWVTLGTPTEIQSVTAYQVTLTGNPGTFAPPWRYIAVQDNRILGSRNGSSLAVLFDGQSGVWAGSGFFETRFDSDELSEAKAGSLTERDPIAGWPGVQFGPAVVVGRAGSQSQCEVIEGRRICPREEAYSFSEREYYRPGVGAVGYYYQLSASFSGGGFFSSSQFEENVALVASSLRGDSSSAPSASSAADLESELAQLVETILALAVIAEMESYNDGDDSAISKFMTREALRGVRDSLVSLANQDLVYVPKFDFEKSSTVDIRVLSNNKIEVDRCEYWSGSYYAEDDGRLIRADPTELVPQTITLENTRLGWFITDVAFSQPPSFC